MRKYYENTIIQTIERIENGHTLWKEFEDLFATLKSNDMLSLEFGWVFGRMLNTSSLNQHEQLVCTYIWKHLVKLVGDENLF